MKLLFLFLFTVFVSAYGAKASTKEIRLKNGQTLVFITQDKSIEFGSYNGKVSSVYLKGKKGLVDQKIKLMRSLKTNWKLKENRPNGFPEIFYVSCRPKRINPNGEVDFEVSYSHILYDGNSWTRTQRTVNGFWEDEGSFPVEALFP